MKKAVAVIAFALVLLFLISLPAMAYDVTKDDFKQPPSVTVTINGKVIHPVLIGNKFYINITNYGIDNIGIVYIIKPASVSTSVTIESRYSIQTDLLNPTIEAFAFGYNDQGQMGSQFQSVQPTHSNSAVLDLTGEYKNKNGCWEINITVTGKIPTPNERLVRLRGLSVEVQGAPSDCLPPVIILVINNAKFRSDLNSAKNKYNQLKSELEKYLGHVDTTALSNDLKCANDNLTAAETLFSSGDYVKADEKLNATENWLNKAENDLKKVNTKYLCKEVRDRNITYNHTNFTRHIQHKKNIKYKNNKIKNLILVMWNLIVTTIIIVVVDFILLCVWYGLFWFFVKDNYRNTEFEKSIITFFINIFILILYFIYLPYWTWTSKGWIWGVYTFLLNTYFLYRIFIPRNNVSRDHTNYSYNTESRLSKIINYYENLEKDSKREGN